MRVRLEADQLAVGLGGSLAMATFGEGNPKHFERILEFRLVAATTSLQKVFRFFGSRLEKHVQFQPKKIKSKDASPNSHKVRHALT